MSNLGDKMQTFYSNGKLLISGEYLVLDGATALALPTVFGQKLTVSSNDNFNHLEWTSLDENETPWFEATFSLPEINVIRVKGDQEVAKTLRKILLEAKRANPSFLIEKKGISVISHLSFPRNWGLGSSSTLINNIAQWAKTDAFELLFKSFGGSGYDIACAQNNQAITYHLKENSPVVHTVDFNPSFKESIYFVHLNRKQVSKESIKTYHRLDKNQKALQSISHITQELILSQDLVGFNALLKEHETIVSQILGEPCVQEKLFSDFQGQTKSLGAWGGDFMLATGDQSTINYFKQKGYHTIIPYTSMILKDE